MSMCCTFSKVSVERAAGKSLARKRGEDDPQLNRSSLQIRGPFKNIGLRLLIKVQIKDQCVNLSSKIEGYV